MNDTVFIYPEKKGDPLIIRVGKNDSPYAVMDDFLHNLYWIQNNDGEGFCLSDMIVVWEIQYDYKVHKGVKPLPYWITLFKCVMDDSENRFGYFENMDDWCEGQDWIFIYDCIMMDDLVYENGSLVSPMHLDFNKVKGHERDSKEELMAFERKKREMKQ